MSITTSLPSYGDRWVVVGEDGTTFEERFASRAEAELAAGEGEYVILLDDHEE